ncbi:MAG: FAD:protein FMN transferase, partial [Pseudomonadales bacterium]
MSRACHRLAAVLLIALCFASASVRAEWFEVTEPIMGTRIHAELWHQDPATAHRLLDAVLDEMRRIENAYSPYIEDSDLSRLNREAGSGWVETTPEMIDLLTKSAEVSRL